jgi:hypothetical protein
VVTGQNVQAGLQERSGVHLLFESLKPFSQDLHVWPEQVKQGGLHFSVQIKDPFVLSLIW